MATSPRLKYPFVAGMGMTVYLVTANVTAAKIAAAASSRVLTISTSLVCGFAQKQKTPELGRPGGTQAPTPPPFASYGLPPFQVGRHWLSVAAPICRLGPGLTVDPGISPGHGPRTTDLGSRILDVRCQSLDPISRIQYPRSFRTRASRAVTADRELPRLKWPSQRHAHRDISLATWNGAHPAPQGCGTSVLPPVIVQGPRERVNESHVAGTR